LDGQAVAVITEPVKNGYGFAFILAFDMTGISYAG
jgi:hypothetical protein